MVLFGLSPLLSGGAVSKKWRYTENLWSSHSYFNIPSFRPTEVTSKTPTEIQFKPARVILQDFTGVPAVVDLAAMRDATKKLGGDPSLINPRVPVDLVIDHSVQVDEFGTKKALQTNEELEMRRNKERFTFLKWGSRAFKNFGIVPPGSGIVHQVNLEYLASVVFNRGGLLYVPLDCIFKSTASPFDCYF